MSRSHRYLQVKLSRKHFLFLFRESESDLHSKNTRVSESAWPGKWAIGAKLNSGSTMTQKSVNFLQTWQITGGQIDPALGHFPRQVDGFPGYRWPGIEFGPDEPFPGQVWPRFCFVPTPRDSYGAIKWLTWLLGVYVSITGKLSRTPRNNHARPVLVT